MDCRYTRSEVLDSSDYTCSQCRATGQASKQLLLKRLPPILSIQFKRFEHTIASKKIDAPVEFPLHLDMTPWLTAREDEVPKTYHAYTLFAVINHQGTLNTGHYTSFVRNKDLWYHFDDHLVTLTDETTVLQSNAYQLLLFHFSFIYRFFLFCC